MLSFVPNVVSTCAARDHVGTKKVVETTLGNILIWLLPAILCVVAILVILGLISFSSYGISILFLSRQTSGVYWTNTKKGLFLWAMIASLFCFFYLGRYAFKRFVFNPLPPEKETN